LLGFVGGNIQWFGAIGTLGTFVIGLVTGIRQAKHQLPKRLVEFMQTELTPVYDNTEALVGAIARRSADAASKQPLYRRNHLYRALDALVAHGGRVENLASMKPSLKRSPTSPPQKNAFSI
jgi:hypothetical protein